MLLIGKVKPENVVTNKEIRDHSLILKHKQIVEGKAGKCKYLTDSYK